jgi:inactivated superfamily I helicase
MTDELTKESDNDTQCELAAWELLKEAREERDKAQALARELRDALLAREELNQVGLLFADEALLRRVDETHQKALTKAKEVLL